MRYRAIVDMCSWGWEWRRGCTDTGARDCGAANASWSGTRRVGRIHEDRRYVVFVGNRAEKMRDGLAWPRTTMPHVHGSARRGRCEAWTTQGELLSGIFSLNVADHRHVGLRPILGHMCMLHAACCCCGCYICAFKHHFNSEQSDPASETRDQILTAIVKPRRT